MDKNKQYIEKDAAIKIRVKDGYNVDGLLYVSWRDVMDYLRAIPPADVKPVVRGEWIENGCITECDNCGEPRRFPHWSFCPNCGADMRKETTHEN